jgi:amino acid transporter
MEEKKGFFRQTKELLIGTARSVQDPNIFHHISLVAIMAWIGLGSDGLTSSCYGPEEAFLTLGPHHALGIFVALATVITIIVVSTSYSQLIEYFPSGGGGYLVASKLLSPAAGVVSGSALIIDYVLTISLSIASGADALFSFLPPQWLPYKFGFAIAGIVVLTVLNMRGIKESIIAISPIFLIFIVTHAVVIIYAFTINAAGMHNIVASTAGEISKSTSALGLWGTVLLVLRAYSMGAGTFTGIEAVSNGISALAEPKVQNAKKTMRYMAASLALIVLGIMVSYVLFKVEPAQGKTLNAVLFENVAKGWGTPGYVFVLVTLISEGALLFVAAQTGFIDGPRVIANMAKDRWLPTRFSLLSDRLVAQNGILLMSVAAVITMFISKGSVQYLVVLYSINVFITFTMSQLGMVIHWWKERKNGKSWKRKLFINASGFTMTAFILVVVTLVKFGEGGWITVFITSALVALCFYVKRHYKKTGKQLLQLDSLIEAAATYTPNLMDEKKKKMTVNFDPAAKTAVVFVNGFNGLGMHTAMSIIRLFGNSFKNFVFVQIGIIDTGNFKGTEEVDRLQVYCDSEVKSYVDFFNDNGYYAEGVISIGTDVVEESNKVVPKIRDKYPDPIFFGGQLVFKEDTFMNNLLHNYIVFQLQQSMYHQGITFVILPIRVY